MNKTITRTLKSEGDKQFLLRYINGINSYPTRVKIEPGKEPRSNQQNRLQFQWLNDAASQGDQAVEEYRAYCKLHFGVPLLRAEDEEFREVYDQIIKPAPYEHKLRMMSPPIDLPVTSRMKVKTMTAYLNEVWQHFTGIGFQLTDPAMLGIDDYERWAA
ncbi:hypothetical protein [Marinobacterium litorale]|uniref:hypothetical protein n=1 Tax=Marinobacterium litorale TaxID=404770 RepID=UPI00040F4FDE|nr:hypothetical protein [Marinobacterium litorale]